MPANPILPRNRRKDGEFLGGGAGAAPDGSDDDPDAHKPAWQRKDLDKELEEIGAIEEAAIRIRRDLQNLTEESERAQVDAEAAALMLDLQGPPASGFGCSDFVRLLQRRYPAMLCDPVQAPPARQGPGSAKILGTSSTSPTAAACADLFLEFHGHLNVGLDEQK